MTFETERLILRPWTASDAESLYEFAKDPRVGPMAGWAVHTSVEDSLQIIETVLSAPETYAVVLKSENRAIGSVGLMVGEQSSNTTGDHEAEIGYWIGVPFWGNGLIPEAVREMMKYAFETLNMQTLWCGYFDGNEKSKRVQEKCGFKFHHTVRDKPWPLINEIHSEHITRITREEWQEI